MSCEQFLDSEFSECDYRQHVVCKDGGKEYRLENDLGEFVCRVKIDKGFIRHGEKFVKERYLFLLSLRAVMLRKPVHKYSQRFTTLNKVSGIWME